MVDQVELVERVARAILTQSMTRHEYVHACPLGFTGRKREHVWIETTMPSAKKRRFSCDCCSAIATETHPNNTGEV